MIPKKTILLADDEFAMRHILKSILRQMGNFDFIEAKNGLEAIQLMKKYKPDLVFLDVYMPTMNGIEALKKIKDNPAINEIPVIMCTAEANPKIVQKVIMSGANDYVVKPFTMEIIHNKTQKWLNEP